MLPLMVGEENKENTSIHMLIFSERNTVEAHKAISWLFTKGEWEEEGERCREWRTLI